MHGNGEVFFCLHLEGKEFDMLVECKEDNEGIKRLEIRRRSYYDINFTSGGLSHYPS